MTNEIEDLKGFHELLGAFLRRIDDKLAPSSSVQWLLAEELELIHKVGSVIKRGLGVEPLKRRQSDTALDLLNALVRDLGAFDTEDPISGAELIDYMANLAYQLVKTASRKR